MLVDFSPEYWAGEVLAQYQWQTNMDYSAILNQVQFSDIIGLYYPWHQATYADAAHQIPKIAQGEKG